MTAIEEAICKLQDKLQGVNRRFAFLGGSVLSLLITDKTVDSIRVTKDVDVMMDIKSRKEYHGVDEMLERMGFRHDTHEDAPICRWICEGVTVDVLPICGGAFVRFGAEISRDEINAHYRQDWESAMASGDSDAFALLKESRFAKPDVGVPIVLRR